MSVRPPSDPVPVRSSSAARPLRRLGEVFGRSLFPFAALALILGTMVWGPWVTLVLAFLWWRVVTRIA